MNVTFHLPLTRAVGRGAAAVGNLLLPLVCARCGTNLERAEDRTAFCLACRGELLPPVIHRCRRCAAPAPVHGLPERGCPICQHVRWSFDRVLALGDYQGALREAVLQAKHVRQETLTLALGRLLCATLAEELSALSVDCVVPVPMHWLRRVHRQVNSPELLAETIARQFGWRRVHWGVRRGRATSTQSSLPPGQRRANVRGAFRLWWPRRFVGKHVLLVDDVLTTGATCHELARLFRKAGAASVNVVAVARAFGHT